MYTVEEVDPGVKSEGVKCTDGNWYKIANRDGASAIQAGQTYNFTIEPSEFNGKTYNWIKQFSLAGNGAAAPAAVPQSPPAAPQSNPAKLVDDKSKQIILQTIIKASASHSGTIEEADMWVEWFRANMAGGYVAPSRIGMQTPSVPQPVVPVVEPVTSDPIPF